MSEPTGRLSQEERERYPYLASLEQTAEAEEPPDTLWLQWYGDAEPDEADGPPAEVTHCSHQVFEHDIEYLRAGEVEKERERIAECLEATASQHKEASRLKGGCHWERGDELERMAREIRNGARTRDEVHYGEES